MCAATLLTPTVVIFGKISLLAPQPFLAFFAQVLVSAAHCFNEKWKDTSWYVRLGDNYIAKKDPSEQTFQIDTIVRHQQFVPLSRPGGDGKNDIALMRIK